MYSELTCGAAVDDRAHLRAAVSASLAQSGYAALSFVGCRVRDDVDVVLEGCVPSYHLKQLAQTFARRVDGVRRVENQLDVRVAAELQRTSR